MIELLIIILVFDFVWIAIYNKIKGSSLSLRHEIILSFWHSYKPFKYVAYVKLSSEPLPQSEINYSHLYRKKAIETIIDTKYIDCIIYCISNKSIELETTEDNEPQQAND